MEGKEHFALNQHQQLKQSLRSLGRNLDKILTQDLMCTESCKPRLGNSLQHMQENVIVQWIIDCRIKIHTQRS